MQVIGDISGSSTQIWDHIKFENPSNIFSSLNRTNSLDCAAENADEVSARYNDILVS